MKKLVASSVLAAFALCALTPRPLHAAPPTIAVTLGTLFVGESEYQGPCLNVITGDKDIITCDLELISGEAVRHPFVFSYTGSDLFGPPLPCDALVTPSGHALVECHS